METKKTIKIAKFCENTTYFAEDAYAIIRLLSRNENEISCKIRIRGHREITDKAQVTIVEYNGKFCESVRLMGYRGWITFYAFNSIIGRSIYELSKEEQEKMLAIIHRDIKFREKHPEYDNHQTVTITDSAGDITGTLKTKYC